MSSGSSSRSTPLASVISLQIDVPGLIRSFSEDSGCSIDLQTVPPTPTEEKRIDSLIGIQDSDDLTISESPEGSSFTLENGNGVLGAPRISILPMSRWRQEPEEIDSLKPFISPVLKLHGIPPRRKALIIGIEYHSHPTAALDGPYHDVDEVIKLLCDVFNWQKNLMTIMKDDGVDVDMQPTRDVIIREMKKLVADSRENDHLLLYYSGHGAQVKDVDGDEVDGYDEAIVPCDCKKILDDELYEILVESIPKGCRLTTVFDCCSSGTCLDLPLEYENPPVRHEIAHRSLPSSPHYLTQSAPRSRHPLEPVRRLSSLLQQSFGRKPCLGEVICWSACQDSERAHSVWDQGMRRKGAMTQALIESLGRNREQTHQQLFDSLLLHMKVHNVAQRPNLSFSRALDMNTLFYL